MLAGTERLTSAEVLPHAPAGQNAKPESSLTSACSRCVGPGSVSCQQVQLLGNSGVRRALDGTAVTAVIQIDSRSEQGSQLTVLNVRGEKVLTGYTRPR